MLGSRVRAELRAFAELLALCGFAIAQPVLDLFGRAPEQLAFRAATRADMWLFAAAVTLGPPLALWVLEVVVGLVGERPRRLLHRLLIVVLAGACAVQAARSLTSGTVLYALAGAIGLIVVALYVRFPAVRLWLAVTALAPLLFAALFLGASDSAHLFDSQRALAIDGGVGAPAPVVMVVLDELPLATLLTAQGEVDADLFPAFAELSRDAHWFRQTTSVASITTHATPAILTGMLPEDGLEPFARDHPENLFTLLGDTYDLEVAESITRLCPINLCDLRPVPGGGGGLRGLLGDAARAMRTRVSLSGRGTNPLTALAEATEEVDTSEPDDLEATIEEAFGTSQPTRFSAFVDGIRDASPTLHYAHLLLPHRPLRHLPNGTRYRDLAPGLGEPFDTWPATEGHMPAHVRQRHVLQTMYTDALLGDLLDTLRARGLYDDALLVVVADHGMAFDPGGAVRGVLSQEMSDEVAAQLMYVPFFVKEPGQTAGGPVDRNVWTVDVLPTIADVLDVDVPWQPDGRSALGPPRADGETSFYVNGRTETGNPLGPRREGDGRDLWPILLTRSIDRFLPPGDDLRPWRTGPRPDLVGRSVDDLPDGAERIDAALDTGVDLDLGDGDAEVPAMMRGTAPRARDEVVVVVNGTVAATASAGSDQRFYVIVSSALFRTGPNRVEVYVLDP